MTVNLDKSELVTLVKGTCPNNNIWKDPLVANTGRYYGGFKDSWEWDISVLKTLTEDQLYRLYNMCKDSWK